MSVYGDARSQRVGLAGEAHGALEEAVDACEKRITECEAILTDLANLNPVLEVEGTTLCALCDTSEHYRRWPVHKSHCPWQRARDMTEEWR